MFSVWTDAGIRHVQNVTEILRKRVIKTRAIVRVEKDIAEQIVEKMCAWHVLKRVLVAYSTHTPVSVRLPVSLSISIHCNPRLRK